MKAIKKIGLSILVSSVLASNSFAFFDPIDWLAYPKKLYDLVSDNATASMETWLETTPKYGITAVGQSMQSCLAKVDFGFMEALGGIGLDLPCGTTFEMTNPINDIFINTANEFTSGLATSINNTIENFTTIENYRDLNCGKDVEFVDNFSDLLVFKQGLLSKIIDKKLKQLKENGVCGNGTNSSSSNSNQPSFWGTNSNSSSQTKFTKEDVEEAYNDTTSSNSNTGVSSNDVLKENQKDLGYQKGANTIVRDSFSRSKLLADKEAYISEYSSHPEKLEYELLVEEEELFKLKIKDIQQKNIIKTYLLDEIEDWNIIMFGMTSEDRVYFEKLAETNQSLKSLLEEVDNNVDNNLEKYIEETKIPFAIFEAIPKEQSSKDGIYSEEWTESVPVVNSVTVSPIEAMKTLPYIDKNGNPKFYNNPYYDEKKRNMFLTNRGHLTSKAWYKLDDTPYKQTGILDSNSNFTGRMTYVDSNRLLIDSTNLLVQQVKSPESDVGQEELVRIYDNAMVESNRIKTYLIDKINKLQTIQKLNSSKEYELALTESSNRKKVEVLSLMNSMMIEMKDKNSGDFQKSILGLEDK